MGTEQGAAGGPARKPILSLTKKDYRIEYYRGSGAGGQNRNKRDTACRVTHPASGAQTTCEEQRSAHQNFTVAFTRLHGTPRFKLWLHRALIDHAAVERAVLAAAQPRNFRTEIQVDGKWTPIEPEMMEPVCAT
jgi:hypothetical protein